ncbi:uncharacterized protein EHS24_001875 [Apiotrichum porosum]|uniref:Protein yippee-like n=1 Tax=Apiotrichum porosum TaxID=105984 RepID=A0A427XJI1_9TREE|nr:uncharacterized protein EHS24_001875 [Apiotrichum porosum]RSH78952.1 hypothetical protein EHS24_001875 [Apiotrichum porosum]
MQSPTGPSAAAAAAASSSSSSSPPTVSALHLAHVPDGTPVFSCVKCSEVLALQDELVSKAFMGRSGRAYLMNSTINTNLGKREDRKLMTGKHTVADLHCAACNAELGWMYIKAPNGEQRYKEGRYILEEAQIVKENGW